MADTYNPILAIEDIRQRSPFEKRLVPEANTALVFYRDGQTPLVIEPGDQAPLRGQLMLGKYNWLYKVDKSEFSWSFECDNKTLHSKTDGFYFQANMTISCSVVNPAAIVVRKVTDIREVVQSLIIESMKVVSRKYENHKSSEAEEAICIYVKQEFYDECFKLNRFVLNLLPDPQIIDDIRGEKLEELAERKITRDSNIKRKSIEEETKLEKLLIEQDKAQLERLQFKMDFYNTALQSGSLMMLAMQLAKSPDDVLVVAQLISQQDQFAANNQLNLLKVMLEEDAIEAAQLGEAGKRVVQRLIGLTESSRPALQSASTDSSTTSQTVSIESESNDSLSGEVPDEFSR